MPTKRLSARFHRYVAVPSGLYEFSLRTEGSSRLWVDKVMVLDRWDEPRVDETATVPLVGHRHDLLMEYRTAEDQGAAYLAWERVAPVHTLYLPDVTRD
jgi:hypothetical protein